MLTFLKYRCFFITMFIGTVVWVVVVLAQKEQEGVTLKEHFQSKIDALDKATDKAATELARRLDGVPEDYATKQEVNAALAPILQEVKELNEFKATMEGKASQTQLLWLGVVSVINMLFWVFTYFRGRFAPPPPFSPLVRRYDG